MTAYCLWISQFYLVLSQSLVLEAQPLKDSAPFLLFGLRQHISRFELDGSVLKHYLSSDDGLMGVVGVDIDIRAGRIFWSDVTKRQLHQADIDQASITNVCELLQGNTSVIDGVAWDWVNHKLYWTAIGITTLHSTIEVMDTDTGCRKVLAHFDDGTKARAIVLDPIRGWIFWSDFNKTTSKIVRMSMDGTNSSVLVGKDTVTSPNGLSLDYATQTLYWIDASTDEIGSIHTDGTKRKIIADHRIFYNLPHPFALEFYREELYFSDWKVDSIWKLTSLSSDKSMIIMKNFSFDPTTIHVVDITRQPMHSRGNPCLVNNGGCSRRLCLLSATPSGYSCVTPDNSLACTAPSTIPSSAPITTIGSMGQSESCLNGGICNTSTTICKEGYTGHNCTQTTDGIQTSMRNFPENFSVSGAVFLGVQGTLLLVIIMIITSIVVIVCSLIKSRTGERSHSIRDFTPQDSQKHEVTRRLSDHNYIWSMEYPAPRTIIIKIGSSPTSNQHSMEKNHSTNPIGMDILIRTNGKACNITNESAHDCDENHSSNNTVNEVTDNAVEISVQ